MSNETTVNYEPATDEQQAAKLLSGPGFYVTLGAAQAMRWGCEAWQGQRVNVRKNGIFADDGTVLVGPVMAFCVAMDTVAEQRISRNTVTTPTASRPRRPSDD